MSSDVKNITNLFEMRLYRYGLVVAFIYSVIQTVHAFIIHSSPAVQANGFINLALILLLYALHRKYFLPSLVVFYVSALITFILAWNNLGGWSGPIPYLLIVMVVFIGFTSHGILQWLALGIYGLVTVLLLYPIVLESLGRQNLNYSILSLEFDFFLITSMLIAITVYLKTKFIEYTRSVELTNERLRNSSETLALQTSLLNEQQMELNAMRNNLEDILNAKIGEVQEKATVLKDYAFVNAHHVRGPLARIFGLIYLSELEGESHPQFQILEKIKEEAQNIDEIIKRINEITS